MSLQQRLPQIKVKDYHSMISEIITSPQELVYDG